jgi:hypothetical protein
MTQTSSHFDQIRSMVRYLIHRHQKTGIKAEVTEQPDNCVKIEVWVPEALDGDDWIEVADYLFNHFGGDYESDFDHVSMDSDETGNHFSYVVR